MAVRPQGKNIVFKFVDRVNSKGEFEREKSAGGIELLAGFDDSAKTPRWANVIAVGPDVKNVKPGDQALLPALRWTAGVSFGESKFWKTDETQIVAIRKSESSDLEVLNNYVLFEPIKRKSVGSAAGLIVPVADQSVTASGIISKLGTEVVAELSRGVKFYYDDALFTESFTHQHQTHSFIKDELILAYEEH